MKEWFTKFWENNGTRIIYGSVCVLFAVGFILSGIKELVATGISLLIGVAMTTYNRMRGEYRNGSAHVVPEPKPNTTNPESSN